MSSVRGQHRQSAAAFRPWLCDQVVRVGCFAIADFICPTCVTREEFMHGGDAFVIWVGRIQAGAFEDTNRMFVPPDRFDLRVTANGSPEYWAEQAMTRLRPVFDPKSRLRSSSAATSLFTTATGLIVEGLGRVGQACIAVCNTHGNDDKNPFDFEYVRSRIEHGLAHRAR